MLKFIEQWRKQRREDEALVKMVNLLKADKQAMIDNLARQVEMSLLMKSPEERQRTISRLRGEK
jgi:hypothetical protein